jgi:hypothetical protein
VAGTRNAHARSRRENGPRNFTEHHSSLLWKRLDARRFVMYLEKRRKWSAPDGDGSRPGLSFCVSKAWNSRRDSEYSAKGPVSRILSCAVIPLGAALPRTLISDLPGGFGNCLSRLGAPGRCAAPPDSWRHFPPYLVLLRVGFTLPQPLRAERCALAAPFHPYPGAEPASCPRVALPKEGWPRRYLFCGTGRPRVLKPASRTLSGTLPCGVRTFLPRGNPLARGLRQRPPGPPASG